MVRKSPPRLACLLLAALAAAQGSGQSQPSAPESLQTEAVAPLRFVAAHGRRSLLMGYSGQGLEAWAFPFQLFRNYHVSFMLAGGDTAIDGQTILRRVVYRPEQIIRIYIGPGFEVREHLFAPLDQPGVILSYEISGRQDIRIRVSFLPVLNLMWPAAIGGQDLGWRDALSAFEISEITTGYRALIGSPQQIAHSPVENSTLRTSLAQSMVLRPVHGRAAVYAALEQRSDAEGSVLQRLEQNSDSLLAAAQAHIQTVLSHTLSIHTPDDALNRAIQWSQIALDQSWVCNPQLGCGLVAGYGPSRGTRRPQYAWFFAGDGLTATEALLAEGAATRARDELAFIFRYQNHANGMIWHELSQSAGFIDWAGKYPYMYVHVDITFAFLSTLADYYEATGDLDFLRAHWSDIRAAYAYCRALINPTTALPQIPLNKEGANEQERMREDVGLSAAWIAASDAYRRLALAAGHSDEAAQAAEESTAARRSFISRYWDQAKNFWIAGYSVAGTPIPDARSHPGLLNLGLFAPGQQSAALDRLASSDFQTDWGTRGMSAASPHFDPDSYASGSVSALGTAEMATAFWRDHRPAIAWPIWRSLLPWFQLDSLGHLHEVAAGDFFHQQVESVPEQTWSSAGFLSAAVHGLLGLDADAPDHRLTLAPHLDPTWNHLSISHIVVEKAQFSAQIEQSPGQVDATFLSEAGLSPAGPIRLTFAPQIPLGATAVRAIVNGKPAALSLDRHEEDEHARVEATLGASPVRCTISYSGGVRILSPSPEPRVGNPSRALKLTGVMLEGHQLTLDADVENPQNASLTIETPWQIQSLQGGTILPSANHLWTVTFADAPTQPDAPFVHRRVTLNFQAH